MSEVQDTVVREKVPVERVPVPYLQTLTMFMVGIEPKRVLSPTAYYRHRRELRKYGYDISKRTEPPMGGPLPEGSLMRLEYVDAGDGNVAGYWVPVGV